jgi:hypothetical protein
MATKLFLRDTVSDLGTISSVTYYDLSTTAGSSSTTATAASINTAGTLGFQISGGDVRWVSPPLASGFTLTSTDVSLWLQESNMAANQAGHFRIQK